MSKLFTSTHLLVFVFVKTAREPKPPKKGDAKYEATIVIPKDHPDVQRIDDAIAEVYEAEKNGKFKGMPLTSRNFWNPLRDGDEYIEEHPETAPEQYAGCYFIKATSTSQPKLWDAQGQDIFDIDAEMYSGVFGRAELKFHPFDTESKGITVFLNSIKKTRDGERLSGGGDSNVAAFDEEEDYSEPATRKAPPRAGRNTAPAAKQAPAARTAPPRPKPAPKKPAIEWATDEEGNDIYSEDGGENWFYPEA